MSSVPSAAAPPWRYWLPVPPHLGLPLGQIAPDFALWDATRQRTVRLANGRGKQPQVLLFCGVTVDLAPTPQRYAHLMAFNAAYPRLRDAGAEVLAVISASPRQGEVMVADLGLSLPLLCNPTGTAFRAYHTGQALGTPLPAQFVLDAQGRLRYAHLFSLLHPQASPEDLLAAVAEL